MENEFDDFAADILDGGLEYFLRLYGEVIDFNDKRLEFLVRQLAQDYGSLVAYVNDNVSDPGLSL